MDKGYFDNGGIVERNGIFGIVVQFGGLLYTIKDGFFHSRLEAEQELERFKNLSRSAQIDLLRPEV